LSLKQEIVLTEPLKFKQNPVSICKLNYISLLNTNHPNEHEDQVCNDNNNSEGTKWLVLNMTHVDGIERGRVVRWVECNIQ